MSIAYREKSKLIINGGDPFALDVTGTTNVGTVTSGTWTGTTIAVTYGGTGATTAVDARTNLGLVIGTDVQAYNSTLAAVAGGTYTGDDSIVTVGTVTAGTWNGSTVAVTYGGTGATTAANARTNLGLVIGTDVQAYNSTLAAVAGGTYTGDDSIVTVGTITAGTWNGSTVSAAYGGTGATTLTGYVYGNGTGAMTGSTTIPVANVTGLDAAVGDLLTTTLEANTSTGVSLTYNTSTDILSVALTVVPVVNGGTGATTASAARTNLGVVIGTDVQAYDAELAALAGLTSAADKLPYFTGAGTASVADFSSFGRSLVDDADASAARTTLGLGSISTQSSSNVSITGGSASGLTQLDVDNLRMDGNTLSSTNENGDLVLSPNGSGLVKIGSNEVATKVYVDGVAQGLDIKQSVRAATTANITLSGTQTIDGVVLVSGNRVLVKNQSTGSENGIYVVAAGSWSRASDSDTDAKVNSGMFTFVEEGTVNADNGFVLTTNDPITLGTTSLVFTQFNGAGQITAGDGLTQTGNTINAVGTADRISVFANSIDIASTYAGQSSIVTVGTITAGTWNGSTIAVVNGGTGATTAADARTNLGVVIGTDVQAYDAELAALAGLTSAADKLPYFTGAGTASVADFSSFGRSLVDDADASAARTTLGVVIGTDVQAYNSTLAAVAGGTYTGDDSIVTVGTITAGTWNGSTIAIANGGTGATTAPDARTNLGLGTISTQDASNVNITGGEVTVSGKFNTGVTLSTNAFPTGKICIRSAIVDLKTVAETNIFTVPTGYMFLIDTMEIVTLSVTSAATAPTVRFGNTGNGAAYYGPTVSQSNSVGARHVVENPQDGATAGTVITFGVTSGSTATAHSGVGMITGYLLKTT